MSFVDTLNEQMQEKFVPFANKLSTQRHLKALRDGMVATVPLSILGGVSLIIATPPFNPNQTDASNIFTNVLRAWFDWAQVHGPTVRLPFFMSMGLMGLFIVFGIASNLAEQYNLPRLEAGVISTVVFLLVCSPAQSAVPLRLITQDLAFEEISTMGVWSIPTANLDARGIFTAIIVSFVCVEVMRLLKVKNIQFKMPEGVPPSIASSFNAILPLFICVIGFYGLSIFIQSIRDGQLIPQVIMTLLAPAMSGLDSFVGIAFIVFLSQLFWFFGLHGAQITQFVRLPFMSAYIVANAAAFAAGEQMQHYFTQPMWSYMIGIGGGGSTLALCFLMLKAKSSQYSQLGKIALIPSIFNINEPLIFGTPLVLNPIMMAPFLFVPVINAMLAYFFMYMGW
ncbi:MAG: PTS transporter subunit EIIC, partial [Streptococcaceae bacterium]|nr:PTS transporter subunit EIIC [Streptococcaceae bacterium]